MSPAGRFHLSLSTRGALLLLVLVAASCASTANTDQTLSDQLAESEIITGTADPVEPAEPGAEDGAIDQTIAETVIDDDPPSTAEEANLALGRGINIGNALDAPREGDWGVSLDAAYFDAIADAGFSHVRLPISWAGYADTKAPYTIPSEDDPSIDHPDYDTIWERVDWAIEQATRNDLVLVLDMHHYDEIHDDPLAEEARFLGMWDQISTRYARAPSTVYFELLNEPHQTFDVEPRLWNELVAKALAVVRETNPDRTVLVGPVGFNSARRLADLELPDDDNLIATVHVYEPFDFTHQGADWAVPVPPVGTSWDPTAATLPPGVSDYSWDTTVTAQDGTLVVDYQQLWAGFSFDYQRGISPTEVTFTVSGESNLKVACRLPVGDVEVGSFASTAEASSYSFDLRGCPEESTGIFIQTTESDPDVLVFESLVLCLDRGCEEIVQTQRGVLDALFDDAAAWAQSNGVPMNVGEFGTFAAAGEAPMVDRARWTAAVQQSAIDRGMSTSYWEFHAGFGAYDLEAGDWIEPIRAALLD